MAPFLERAAIALLQRHQHELDQVAVVLPGQRAGLHLRRYLADAAGTVIWSPEMLNMGSFLQRLSGLQQADAIEMLFLFHEVHLAVMGAKADPLPEFLQWAPITLRDMSEMDAHLLDPDRFYRDLRNFHEIDDWSFKLGDLSQGQQRLAQQWTATGEQHRRLLRLMDEKGRGTSGWLERRTAERIGALIEKMPWKSVWFVGMNAFDPATTRIVQALQAEGRAVIAWDHDRFYLEDRDQEAGHFLRRSIAALGEGILPPVNALRELPRKIHTVAVPNAIAQTRYAAQLLADLPEEQRKRTAIVLAQEDLLLPLLDALPEEASPYNVTMGMPLRSLPIHGLFEAFLDLHASHSEGSGFHHAAIERLLLHPFLHQRSTAEAIKALRESQSPRLDHERIVALAEKAGMIVPDAMRSALVPVNGEVRSLQERIIALIAWAKENCAGDAFATEQLFHMARLQQRLDRGLQRTATNGLDIRSYVALRTRMLREEKIGFFGEPLSGVQILGFLETRSIDHERLIVLGANEGVLPANGSQQSWIPFEIRRAFGMPLPHDSASITAYHFQRMMHGAGEVHLVYDASGEAGPTRYIEQWKHDLIGNSNTTSEHHTVVPPFPERHAPVITIHKDEHVLARLKAIGEHGFSPSALSTWLTCPLDMYFKYILRISEAEEVDEKLAADVLGQAVHNVMEGIFRPFLGTPLQPEMLREKASITQPLLIDQLSGRFPLKTLEIGHFRLRIEMAARALSNYLVAEADRCERSLTRPLMLEADIAAPLPDGTIIRGRCDRIDERDGIHYILDLKTGSVRPDQVEFRSLEREQIVPKRKFGLQLLIYAWVYMMNDTSVERVRAGIIPLQKASQAEGVLLKIEGAHDISRAMLPRITELLSGLIDELMDPSIPFTHMEDSLYCTCCTG